MGVRFPSVGTTAFVTNVPAAGTQAVIFTLPPLNLPLDFAQVLIWWDILCAVGAGTTSAQLQLIRGATAPGTRINASATVPVTAGNNTHFTGCFIDTPGAVGGQQYSVTLQGTATTGAWTNLDGSMIAIVL